MKNEDLVKIANQLTDKNPNLPYLDPSFEDRGWHVDIIDQGLTQLWKSKQLLLPNLKKSKSIGIFSDYSGELHSSTHDVYTFLICDFQSVEAFSKKTKEIREKTKLDQPYKEMEFKSLKYGPIKRALSSWLDTADTTILGLLVNVIIDKKIETISSSKEQADKVLEIMKQNNYSLWKKSSLEKVIRITHMIGYFYGLLGSEDSNVFWMSDDDNIACNEDKKNDLLRMFRNSIAAYSKGKKMGKGGFATPFKDDQESKMKMKDLLSLADLSAGVISNYLDTPDIKANPKEGRETIMEWIDHPSVMLKKLTISMELDENKQLRAGFCDFKRHYEAKKIKNQIPIFI